jgi:uncharacterized membrane protein
LHDSAIRGIFVPKRCKKATQWCDAKWVSANYMMIARTFAAWTFAPRCAKLRAGPFGCGATDEGATMTALAVLIGIVAGLRAFTAPAAVSLAARYGHLGIAGTPLAFLGYRWTPWILVLLAVAELVGDQLPATPSRKVPLQFGTRIVMGALAGGAMAASAGILTGAAAGAVGAVIGTLGGAAARAKLAAAFRQDRPAALIEDVIAIGGAWLLVCCLA